MNGTPSPSGSKPSDEISVCHVINAFGETTGPANHAVAIDKLPGFDVGLLGWFKTAPFDGDDRLRTYDLNAPDTTLGVDWSTLKRASGILSGYDIVHTHHPHSATFCKLLARTIGVPTVFTYGTDPSKYTVKGRLANGLTNRFADRVTCVSPAILAEIPGWERRLTKGAPIEVVYTGVDLEYLETARDHEWYLHDTANIPETAWTVGHAGRLMRAKGQDTLIRAIARTNEVLDEHVYLVIAGDGELQERLESLAGELGIRETVRFLGQISRGRTYQMMNSVDLFAMPSRWEGFASAALEAMALGTACVYSDIPAFREPFEEVAKFHPVDDPKLLADEIATLLSNSEERSRLGAAGSQLVRERYTMRRTAEEYADIYEALVDR